MFIYIRDELRLSRQRSTEAPAAMAAKDEQTLG